MFGSGQNPFDPSVYAEMFKSMDMSKMFDPNAFKALDQSALAEAQKKNIDALISAQKAAAAGYQDLFEKQVKVFQDTLASAQGHIEGMAKSNPSDAAKAQAEMTAKAYEAAIANAQELAEAARRANQEAYDIVRARIEESVAELKASMS